MTKKQKQLAEYKNLLSIDEINVVKNHQNFKWNNTKINEYKINDVVLFYDELRIVENVYEKDTCKIINLINPFENNEEEEYEITLKNIYKDVFIPKMNINKNTKKLIEKLMFIKDINNINKGI